MVAGIREVWCDEESGRAKLEVVPVPVTAKCSLPLLCARHVGMLNSNVLRAVLALAGMPGREHAEPRESLGLAMFSASMKSSADVSASI